VILRNVRLLLIPLANIIATATTTICIMYLVSNVYSVSSQAPALIVASGLAMSIDYSLFLLTRFSDEVHRMPTSPTREAIVVPSSPLISHHLPPSTLIRCTAAAGPPARRSSSCSTPRATRCSSPA
jgi:predicted RND superfamily exporter protein